MPQDNSPLGALASVSLMRSYLWDVVFPPLGGGTDLPDRVSEMCRSVSFGNGISMETNKTREGAFVSFTSGQIAVSEVSMTFLSEEGNDSVLKYILEWMARIVSSKSVYNPKSFYAREITVIQFGTEGDQEAPIRLAAAFPKGLKKSVLDFEGDKMVMWDVVFSVDRVYFDE